MRSKWLNMFKKGDKVKWIGPTVTIGPGKKLTAISTGDIRIIESISTDRIYLSGPNGKGIFGSIDKKNIKKI